MSRATRFGAAVVSPRRGRGASQETTAAPNLVARDISDHRRGPGPAKRLVPTADFEPEGHEGHGRGRAGLSESDAQNKGGTLGALWLLLRASGVNDFRRIHRHGGAYECLQVQS